MKSKWVFAIILLMTACGGDDYIPRPQGYPRLELPQKKYQNADIKSLAPFSFELPQYAALSLDTLSNYEVRNNWYNIYFKPFNATLHLTYHSVGTQEEMDSLIYDTRKLVNKQIDRAQDIREMPITDINPKLDGVFFDIIGHTATNLNFYLSDYKKHFVRGALYFNYAAAPDSVAPIYKFMKNDVEHLIKTFEWKK
jgi:gliding motility-associated lipoprotein GldD